MLTHLVPLRSIDADDEDYRDLMPIAAAIGDARVVGLGEARHGDGHAYKAKVRLTKFLHAVMGFDVLAWESGLFACRDMDAALRAAGPPAPPECGIYSMWRLAEEVQPLFDLARTSAENGRRLEMAGFDCRLSDGRSDRLVAALFGFVDAVDPGLVDPAVRARVGDLIERVDRFEPPYDPTPDERMVARAAVQTLVEALLASRRRFVETHGAHEPAFWHEVLQGLLDLESCRGLDPMVDGRPVPVGRSIASTNVRDASMARLARWLVDERYAGRKVVLWAASFHLCAHHAELGFGPDVPGLLTGWPPEVQFDADLQDARYQYPMGEHLRRQLGDAYYTIGCTAHSGMRGTWFETPEPIEPALPGSVEAILHDAGVDHGFIDLRGLPPGHPLRAPVRARPLGHGQQVAVWPRHLDALCFVDRGFPATRARQPA